MNAKRTGAIASGCADRHSNGGCRDQHRGRGAGLTILDYAPKVLAATEPTAGSQVFVDVVPVSRGTWQLTARLVPHVGGDRPTRHIILPLAVSGPETVLPAQTTVRDSG